MHTLSLLPQDYYVLGHKIAQPALVISHFLLSHLFEVFFLPGLLAVDLEEAFPVRRDVSILLSAHEHPVRDVVEPPLFARRLPA